jgi:nitrogen regulatory protein P-II 2
VSRVPLKLVTIVAEAFLEDRLIREIRRLGAKGYTLSPAKGEGSRGVRASEWEGSNIRLEVITSPALAEQLLDKLAHSYFADYAVIAFMQTVEVVRGEKYS